jgi:hypothetical protein
VRSGAALPCVALCCAFYGAFAVHLFVDVHDDNK